MWWSSHGPRAYVNDAKKETPDQRLRTAAEARRAGTTVAVEANPRSMGPLLFFHRRTDALGCTTLLSHRCAASRNDIRMGHAVPGVPPGYDSVRTPRFGDMLHLGFGYFFAASCLAGLETLTESPPVCFPVALPSAGTSNGMARNGTYPSNGRRLRGGKASEASGYGTTSTYRPGTSMASPSNLPPPSFVKGTQRKANAGANGGSRRWMRQGT